MVSFIWPWVLVSLLALPVCVYAYVRLNRRRSGDAARLGTIGEAPEGSAAPAGRLRHVPPLVILTAVSLLAVASARPQVTLPLPRMQGTVMLAMDVSSSMAAEDVEPTRMDAAKLVATTLVERRPDHSNIGVVAFGEGGLVVQPPTDDDDALLATIERLAPYSGTSLGRGMLTALNLVAPESEAQPADLALMDEAEPRGAFAPAIIVLLTDGENTDPPEPLEVAQTAIERGVRVYTVGIGTEEGATIEVDGFNLFTQLNQPVLEEIALLTEGVYFMLDDMEDTPLVYEELETEFVVESREVEVTSFLGGVSALLLLAGGLLSLFWFGRMP